MNNDRPKDSNGCFKFALIAILVVIVFVFCSFSSMIAILSMGTQTSSERILDEGSADRIAVINVNGMILQSIDSSIFSAGGGVTPSMVRADLDSALSDPSVKAIILYIESPGGEAVASDVIREYVSEASQRKPVVAYSGSIAASGGYMIASAADNFVVHPGVLTGSIGVILETSSIDGLYEKLGIETVTFKSGEFKDDSELYDGVDGEIETIYQGIVDEAYNDFVDMVAEGRQMDRETVVKLADGRLYTGRQAVANGLADSMGYFEKAVQEAEELAGISGSTIVEYGNQGFWDALLGTKVQGIIGSQLVPNSSFGVYYLPDITR